MLSSIRQTAQMRVCVVPQQVPASAAAICISLPAGQATSGWSAWLPCGSLRLQPRQCQTQPSCHNTCPSPFTAQKGHLRCKDLHKAPPDWPEGILPWQCCDLLILMRHGGRPHTHRAKLHYLCAVIVVRQSSNALGAPAACPRSDILLNSEATCCCDVTEDAWRGGESTDPWAAAPARCSEVLTSTATTDTIRY